MNMGKTFSEIESEAMALPVKERAALARDLIESLDVNLSEECEQAWAGEAERRYDAYHKGEIGSRLAENVIAELKNQYK